MATIRDIAKAAGVSHGTVSNVLNKRGGVSYEKIKLVEQAVKALGYTIDEKASQLRSGTTRTIAVILPSISLPHYAHLYTGILRYAQSCHYSVRLFLSDDLPYRERQALSEALSLKVCAVLTVSCLAHHKKEYQTVLSKKIPLLFLERPAQEEKLCSYSFNQQQAAQYAADILPLDAAICLITGETSFPDQSAFLQALRHLRELPDENHYENFHDEQSPAAYALLQRNPLPRYVVCTNEALANKVHHIYMESGLDSPVIITLASLRTSHNASYYNIQLNYRMLGHEAAIAVIGQADSMLPPMSRVFPVSQCTRPFSSPAAIKRQRPLRILAHETPAITALKLLLPRFTQSTGIPVELHIHTLDEVFSLLLSKEQSQWDVVRLDPSSLSYLGPRVLRHLDEIDMSAPSLLNQFLPNLQNDFSVIGGKLYALPFDISVQMLFYQRSLFENVAQSRAYYEETGKTLEVPRTYEEFDMICRFFTKKFRSDSPIEYGGSLAPRIPTSVSSDYLPRLLAAGGLSYSRNGCLDLTTPAALSALRRYIDYADCTSQEPMYSWSEIAENFISGQTATAIMYMNHASRFINVQNANAGVEVGFAPIPGGCPLLGGGSLGVCAGSQYPQDAYAFIKWATSEKTAPEMVMLGGVSACRTVYEYRDILDTYPWLSALQNGIRMGIRRPILSPVDINYNQRDFEYTLGKHLIQALQATESPEEALINTQKTLDAIR